MSKPDLRIMRIQLPVPLIRDMDDAIIKGVGGYATRAEFIVDAIQERILELSIPAAEDASDTAASRSRGLADARSDAGVVMPLEAVPGTVPLSVTALAAPLSGPTIESAMDLSRPEDRPLFGLHNRDYPSLWALALLAKATASEPVPAETFYAKALSEAWQFGELLIAIERHLEIKCTALFPTNTGKRKPAELGFRTFAIGDYRRVGDTYATNGPLFEWRLAGLVEGSRDEPLIGLTAGGWEVLRAVAGVSVEQPHSPGAAADFLAYLAKHAPADRRGFTEVVNAIGSDGATRQEVLDHVAGAWPDWTENEVSTNSAGYIARAREWGLVVPKQTKSQYHLTVLGHQELTHGAQS